MSWNLPTAWTVGEVLSAFKLNALRASLQWLGETLLRVNEQPANYPIRLEQAGGSFVFSSAANVAGVEVTALNAATWWTANKNAGIWMTLTSTDNAVQFAELNIVARPATWFNAITYWLPLSEQVQLRVYAGGDVRLIRTAGTRTYHCAFLVIVNA